MSDTENKTNGTVSGSMLIQSLSLYISKAFDNDEEFLSEFRGFCEGLELKEIHMASGQTRIVVIDHDKCHSDEYYIGTREFIDWCEQIDK